MIRALDMAVPATVPAVEAHSIVDLRTIRVRGFPTFDEAVIDLPPRGIVLVTGANGEGKSSLIEAVPIACWNKTLRGESFWRDGQPGAAAIVIDGPLLVVREWSGKKASLDLLRGSAAVKYESMTKAQEALDLMIGEFRIWRRTHVFSSHDADNFTRATDAECKRLIELMLGLDRFDAAAQDCRKEQADSSKRAAGAYSALAQAMARLEEVRGAGERLGRLAPAAAPAPPLEPLRQEAAGMRAELAGLDQNHKRLLLALEAASKGAGSMSKDVIISKALAESPECPVCEQTISDAIRESARNRVAVAERKRQEATATLIATRKQISDLEKLRSDTMKKNNQLVAQINTIESQAAHQKRADTELGGLQATQTKLEAEVKLREGELAVLRAEVKELDACEQVLGLRGVRAMLTSRMLQGLEQSGNVHLAKITGDLHVKLAGWTTNKDGRVVDAINRLYQKGNGPWREYGSFSGGERRRIDVALLLALSDMNAAAYGVIRRGTMFFDEVFDALDDEGVEAIALVLADLARDRCVAVISHSQLLASKLSPVLRLHVAGGKIHVR